MSNSLQNGNTGGPDKPERADYGRRCRDRRMRGDMWIPRYVWRYAAELGTNGVALYVCLAFHCTSSAPVRWPSHRQIAELLGVSRSTIERTFRLLRALQMFESVACITHEGQKSNYWDLVDPPGEREQPDSQGTENAGPVTSEGGVPSPLTGGAVTSEGGAPSLVTAPSLCNGSEKEREKGPDSLSRAALSQEDQRRLETAQLAAHWLAQLPIVAQAPRDQHFAEVAAEVAELLRRGWTPEQLRGSMDTPERDRMEWPRQWRARCHPGKPKVARMLPDPAEVAHKRAQDASEREKDARAVAEMREKLGGTLNPLDPRFRKDAIDP